MTRREDNALLDLVEAQIEANEEGADALQVAAACIAFLLIPAACFLVLHLRVPM